MTLKNSESEWRTEDDQKTACSRRYACVDKGWQNSCGGFPLAIAAMARWISDLEGGSWLMHCPDLYLCVIEACDVSSLELTMVPSRNGQGRSPSSALKAILGFYSRKSVHSGQCATQF